MRGHEARRGLRLAGLVMALLPAGAARAGVSAGLEVAQERALPVAAGTSAVRQRSFSLHGIPVRRAFETVVVDADGERVVAGARPTAAPELRPHEARIGREAAAAAAHAHLRATAGAQAPAPEEPGELVYLPILGVPVLAWQVEMPLTLAGPEPSRKTIWISASSGIVLDEWEHVRSSRARVFLTNPARTPVPIEVALSGVHADGPGAPLIGDRVQSYNCALEEPEDELPEWWEEGKCYPVHRALSNDDGDFFLPLPNIVLPEDNADGDDPYAELSMYWHAERFLDRMAALGVEEFKCELSTMLANYRTPELSPSYPDLEYTPLNNAYWTNTCDPTKGATMIFGQGAAVDFGYDGDVVYHELGHGMVSLLTPDGLGTRRERHDALLADAGGINEAVADYFSVMLTNDPLLGDYVARFWPGYGDAIRDAENTKVCPDDTVGQVHNDGEPFMAALWAARKRIGADKLDPLVIDLLPRLPPDADLETASWTVYDLAVDRVGRGTWTEHDLTHLVRAFDTRNLYDCARVITDEESVSSGRTMYLRQKSTAVTPFYPGPMQLRHRVAEGTDNVVVRFRATAGDGPPENPVGIEVLLKRADEPIRFEYTLTALDKAAEGGTKPSVREVIEVSGDWDLELQASLLGESDNQLVIRGFRPGEVVHVTLVNLTAGETVAGSVAVLSLPTEFLDEGTVHVDAEVGETDTETETDAGGSGADEPEVDEGRATASCACRGEGGAAGLLALAPLLAARRRRRRRPA
jgi:hypothetical protein